MSEVSLINTCTRNTSHPHRTKHYCENMVKVLVCEWPKLISAHGEQHDGILKGQSGGGGGGGKTKKNI